MKPQLILELEQELNASSKIIEFNKIDDWKEKRTFEYSADDSGNISGIAIRNDLEEIPKTLSGNSACINYLTSLNLAGNIISDIKTLAGFKNLKSLDLSNNQIIDISPLKDLKNLQVLWLRYNQISDISPLEDLKNIQEIYLTDNQISDISALKKLTKIQNLELMNNTVSDISILENMKQLKNLYLWGNQIINIDVLKNLKNLSTAYLGNNPIKKIEYWISELKIEIEWNNSTKDNNGFITFYDNPIENVPIEVIKQGKKAIKKYFKELYKEQQQYNFEVKLMLIGEGGTGKTSVMRKLLDKDNELPNEKDTTLGIDIQKWNFPINDTLFKHLPALKQENMLVNIWDLGGQKIYHGTHQIFFGENTFYILVEETREHKTDFSYWFNTIEQLAGEKANLLVVINEKFGHVIKFDSDGYKTKFGFVNQPFQLDLSKNDDKIVRLQEIVKNAIQFLPNIGMALPASYIRIKEVLFKTGKNFIGLDAFLEICNQQGISEFDSVKVLSKYLHETGAITHFIDDDVLQNRVFLNSEWLVKTLYKVLDEQTIKHKKGRISKEEVCKIWRSENLGFEITSLTQLMHKFGLMYKVKDQDEYVIPAHLPTEKPYAMWNHQYNGHHLIFKYEFGKYMPEGLMSHLIVSLHSYIEDEKNVWHRGVNLMYEKTFAEIIETYGEINTFEIKISGLQKREMLAIIRENFTKIIKPFKKLYYRELMPCNCKECKENIEPYFYIFENLQKRLEKNIFKVQCERSYKEIDVRKLIDSVIIEEGFVDIKQLIANNELEKALNEALQAAKKQKNTDKEIEIALLSARYSKNENSQNKGILDEKDYRLERNRIADALLSIDIMKLKNRSKPLKPRQPRYDYKSALQEQSKKLKK
ncbi:MAG: COR domain-containing protein [Mariniphaga sp.]